MPTGFFTIEQWQPPEKGVKAKWKAILQLDCWQSRSKAVKALEKRGKPGLFRVVQTQRCLWGERENGKLKLHGSHAGSIKGLEELAKIFQREGGRRPVEKARQDRLAAKARRRLK